jgi:uncharacterized protein YndB with AHSA1/START domain
MSEAESFEHKGRMLQAEMRTKATPEQVWEAWADPHKIAQWFVDRALGDAKAGNVVTWFFDDFGFELPYKVLEAEPGKSFVLKWEPPNGPAGIHEVRIERKGGETLMRMIESGFKEGAEWDEEYEGVNCGWKNALAILKLYLENYFGQDRRLALVMRPAAFEYERIAPFFQDETKLAAWLTQSGTIGNEGEICNLTLRDGRRLSGDVIARTDRGAAVSWREIEGVLELKAFSMGPQRFAGVRVMSWRCEEVTFLNVVGAMNEAVERLAARFPAKAGASGSAGA